MIISHKALYLPIDPTTPHLFTRLFLSLLRLRLHFFSAHSEIYPNFTNKPTRSILAAVIGIATAK